MTQTKQTLVWRRTCLKHSVRAKKYRKTKPENGICAKHGKKRACFLSEPAQIQHKRGEQNWIWNKPANILRVCYIAGLSIRRGWFRLLWKGHWVTEQGNILDRAKTSKVQVCQIAFGLFVRAVWAPLTSGSTCVTQAIGIFGPKEWGGCTPNTIFCWELFIKLNQFLSQWKKNSSAFWAYSIWTSCSYQ